MRLRYYLTFSLLIGAAFCLVNACSKSITTSPVNPIPTSTPVPPTPTATCVPGYFGDTSTAVSNNNLTTGQLYASVYTLNQTTNITQVEILNASNSYGFEVGIYSDNSDYPNSFIAGTSSITGLGGTSGSPIWTTAPLVQTLSAGTYWVAVVAMTTHGFNSDFDTDSFTRPVTIYSTTSNTVGFPSTFPSVFSCSIQPEAPVVKLDYCN